VGWAASLILCVAVAFSVVAFAFPSAPPDIAPHGRATDCTPDVRLGSRPSLVRYVVWCGTAIGRVKFSIHPAKSVEIARFAKLIEPVGAGAKRAFRCHARGNAVLCVGRKSGPVTVNGWIAVPSATRCSEPITLKGPYDIFGGTPRGCPSVRPEKAPNDFSYFRGFRQDFGLDPDLHNNRRAINRRIRELLRAWRRGNPVARWTASSLGLPLRARDQRELDYRQRYIDRNGPAIERWGKRRAASTYAGYDVDHEHGGVIYIGFVGNQRSQLAAFKRQAKPLAPGRIKPFPVAPTHSEQELNALLNEIVDDAELWAVINEAGVDTLGNKVEVGTEHVAEVRALLAKRYGPDAPFKVVFARPLVLL